MWIDSILRNRIKIVVAVSNHVVVSLLVLLGFCFVTLRGQLIFAQDQQPSYIVLIDISRSMRETPKGWQGSKIDAVKEQLTEFLVNLPVGTEVFAYTFNTQVPDPDNPLIHARIPRDQDQLEKRLNSLRTQGGTYAWDSLRSVLGKARSLLKQQPNRPIRIFMFTDGEDTRYKGTKSARELDKILNEYDDIIHEKSLLRYVKMTFTLREDVSETFARHNVPVINVISPEKIIPIEVDFIWSPSHPTIDSVIQFTDRSTGRISNYEWNFGDGEQSAEKAPQHQYKNAGEFDVILRIQSVGGDWYESTKRRIHIERSKSLSAIGRIVPAQVPLGQPVVFINESEGGSKEFEWDFGDGQKSEDEHPSHIYKQAGEFLVHLTIKRGRESSSAVIGKVTVLPPIPPKASFQYQDSGYPNDKLWFVDTSEGLTDEREWDFGDGSPIENIPTTHRVDHAFEKSGTYRVTLKIKGPGGSNNVSHMITIHPWLKPKAAFRIGTSAPRIGESIRFFDQTEGRVDSVQWDFGDGSEPVGIDYRHTDLADATEVEHVYRSYGSFVVRLTVHGPGGDDSVIGEPIEIIKPSAPKASFVVGTDQIKVGDHVRFSDQSTGIVNHVKWSFGDGSDPIELDYIDPEHKPELKSVEHQFTNYGDFVVTLIASGQGGSSDPSKHTIHIPLPPPPKAHFTAGVSEGIVGKTVRFTDQSDRSEGSVTEAQWDFGDGSPSRKVSYGTGNREEQIIVEHIYQSPGSFTVSLTVSGPNGENTESLDFPVVGDEMPQAVITTDPQPAEGRESLTVTFKNESKGKISHFIWDFGDGSPTITQSERRNQTHTYGIGRFVATLKAEGLEGIASDVVEVPILVKNPFPWYWLWIALGAVVLAILGWGGVWAWKASRERKENKKLFGTLRYWETDRSDAEESLIDLSRQDGSDLGETEIILPKTDGYDTQLRVKISKLSVGESNAVCSIQVVNSDGLAIGFTDLTEYEVVQCGPFSFEWRADSSSIET